jgi:predicted nucleotidyltransferase
MMTLYLDEKYLDMVKEIMHKQIPNRTVIAFGSRVKGGYKAHSDLDLCIMGEQPLSLQQLDDLREACSESDLSMRVDLVDWAVTDDSFKAVIKEHFVIIQQT